MIFPDCFSTNRLKSDVSHEFIQPLIPSDPAPDLLAKYPKRDSQRTNCEEACPEHVEYGQWSVFGKPVIDKVGQTKSQQVSSIDGHKGFFCQSRVTVLI